MNRFILLVGLSCIAGLAQSSPSSLVSPSLLAKVAGGKRADIAIVINSPVSTVYDQYHGKSYPQKGQKMTALRQSLIELTTETQAPVRSFLESKGVQFKAMWITNRIFVKNADESLITELSSSLRSSIAEIREQVVAQIDPIVPVFANKTAVRNPARGVNLIGAPKLWEAGNTGEGMVVSNIDTGVRGTHEILASNFVGEYGWYDPATGSQTPTDDNGHGTHTMGTIAGQNGFGVAPGAKWMACAGCGFFGCFEEDLIGCAQFTACPHLPDGSNSDCNKAPQVSSNSWGSTLGGQDWYDEAIEGMKSAGVIVVFSAGNAGSSCGTVGSPGDRNVIGVAATDFNDGIATFSSRGPAVSGDDIKPDVSAPGVEVLSSWNSADTAYSYLSGTSMACPHVSGAVALLIAGNPQLAGDYKAVKAAILENAEQNGLNGGQTCGGIPVGEFPNHVFGHGRLDVARSAGID